MAPKKAADVAPPLEPKVDEKEPDEPQEPPPPQQLPGPVKIYEELARGPGENLKKTLSVFQEFDADGSGAISPAELQAALRNRTGMVLSAREFRKILHDVDTTEAGEIDIREFNQVIKKLFNPTKKEKAKNANMRNPRAYLLPEQYDQYSELFQGTAGPDGLLDAKELGEFLAKHNMKVSGDRLKAIMAEVDDDNSGYLDEIEFLTLLIKAMGLKKRKVGPGQCEISELEKEGWSLADLKRGGYECDELMQAGYTLDELMECATPHELGQAGISVPELMKHGWDCMKAREAGFAITEFVNCGCSVRLMRAAGWADVASAAHLLKLGVSAKDMKAGGWGLSELRLAGYSTCDLRLAGYSDVCIRSLQRVLSRKANLKPPKRRSTFDLQRAVAPLAVTKQPPINPGRSMTTPLTPSRTITGALDA